MKRAAPCLALLWLLTGGGWAETSGQTEPGTVAEFAAAIAQLDREREAKLLAVDTALRVEARQGRLSVVTEAYYLDLLSRFRAATPGLTATPPRFDASPEMAPINNAWAELRGEELRQSGLRAQLTKRLQAAATTALQTAVRNAEKPEDLQMASSLYDYLGVLSPASPSPFFMPNAAPEPLGTLIPCIMEALAARQTKDAPRLRRAFLSLSPSYPGGYLPAMPLPPSAARANSRQPLVDEFKNRMLADYVRDVREAQKALERALMARRPAADLDRAYAGLQTVFGPLRFLEAAAAPRETSPTFPRRNNPAEKGPFTESCVAALAFYDEAIARLSGQGIAVVPPSTKGAGTEIFGLGSEFRDFLAALRRETEVPAVRKSLLSQVAEINTPEQAAACADAIRQAPATSGRNDALASLEQELRQLAVEWQTGTLSTRLSRQTYGAYSPPELEAVRQRAFREQTASRLALPELLQPPLAGTPLPEALGKAAAQAAERREWRRALALYGASDQDAQRPSEQARAIEEFLVAGQLEQAGLYVEAAEVYEAVLRQVAEHTPVQESAARVKLLRTEHPDAFKER